MHAEDLVELAGVDVTVPADPRHAEIGQVASRQLDTALEALTAVLVMDQPEEHLGLVVDLELDLIDLVWNGEIDPGRVFDLTLPLDQAAEGYKAMDERRATKVLLTL